jgi:hypothetical protein
LTVEDLRMKSLRFRILSSLVKERGFIRYVKGNRPVF